MSYASILKSALVAGFLAIPSFAIADSAQMKSALGCEVAGSCSGTAEGFDACSNTKLGSQIKPPQVATEEGVKIIDPCKGMPAAVCAACADGENATCTEAREKYCNKLGWCSN